VSVKRIAWGHSKKCCAICGQRFALDAHHLNYNVLGSKQEWRWIRFLCRRHHRMVSYCFWVVKLHGTSALVSWYYAVKIRYILTNMIWRFSLWIYDHMINVEWDDRKQMWVPKSRY
jgi:hypothetical protein